MAEEAPLIGQVVYVIFIRKPTNTHWLEPFVLFSKDEQQALNFLSANGFPGEVFKVHPKWLELQAKDVNVPIIEIDDMGEHAVWEFHTLEDERQTFADRLKSIFKNSPDA
jgi:hypothetical protein